MWRRIIWGAPIACGGRSSRGARPGGVLGFPTANVAVPPGRLVPAFGVYACWAWRRDRGYPAVVNVGVRPTFDRGQPSVEAHLLNFEGDLYGETLGLSFIRRLRRGERKFAEVGALVAQIGEDVEAARIILGDPPDDALIA